MARSSLVALVVFGGLLAVTEAHAADVWSDPFPGVRRLDRTTSTPIEAHALVVNLCAAGVRLRATAPSEGSRITSSFGNLVGAEAAINGDFYASGRPIGLAIGNGTSWGTSDSGGHGFIAFGQGTTAISFPWEVVSSPPAWMREVVGGNVALVTGGTPNTSDTGSFCTTRHPRTMVGLSADRGTLYLAVVDGRSSRSVGMRCDEMALFMKGLGAHDALNLDGGGSTTMWVRGSGVINRPSDGSERTVVNHLALYAKGAGEAWSCNRAPRGYLDKADCDGITGWAQDLDAPTTPINVHLYVGGPPGDPAGRGFSVRADVDRSDLCAPLGSCNHGYVARLPPFLQDDVERPVFAYGIDASGGSNTLLTGSPKTIKCGPRPPVAAANGVKRHVTSPTVIGAWRFIDADIARVPDAFLETYPTGPKWPATPELIQVDGKPEVYVRDLGARRHVLNPTVLADWRFKDIKGVPQSDVDDLLPGAPTPSFPYLVRGTGPEVYVLDAPPPLGAELVEYDAPPSVTPGSVGTITIRLKNRGSMTWEPGVAGIAPVEPRDHESTLCDASSWSSCKRAGFVAAATKPGEVGEFRFAIRAPSEKGLVRECWALYARTTSGTEHWASDEGQLGPDDRAICRDVLVSDEPLDAGAADASTSNAANSEDLVGGCACRASSPSSHGGGGVWFLAGAAIVALHRRRGGRK